MKVYSENKEKQDKLDKMLKTSILDLEELPTMDNSEIGEEADLLLNLFNENINNYEELIQVSYNELINKLALLNRFEIMNDQNIYFLENNFNEKELYGVLTELENYGIPKEFYVQFASNIDHLEFLTSKYKYSKKEKLVNLYNLKKVLKEKNIVMTYKDKK